MIIINDIEAIIEIPIIPEFKKNIPRYGNGIHFEKSYFCFKKQRFKYDNL